MASMREPWWLRAWRRFWEAVRRGFAAYWDYELSSAHRCYAILSSENDLDWYDMCDVYLTVEERGREPFTDDCLRVAAGAGHDAPAQATISQKGEPT